MRNHIKMNVGLSWSCRITLIETSKHVIRLLLICNLILQKSSKKKSSSTSQSSTSKSKRKSKSKSKKKTDTSKSSSSGKGKGSSKVNNICLGG